MSGMFFPEQNVIQIQKKKEKFFYCLRRKIVNMTEYVKSAVAISPSLTTHMKVVRLKFYDSN